MSISDRLDQIEQRYGDVSIADASRYTLIGRDVPDMLAALRAVLSLHVERPTWPDLPYPYCVECGQILPCATVRAIATALASARIERDLTDASLTKARWAREADQ